MTLILDVFDDRSVRMRLDEVVEHTHLPRSTCYRILEQLVRLHWLRQRPSGYALGPRAIRLGGHDAHDDLRVAARPVLEELQAQTGATVYLGVLDFDEVVYLDRVAHPPVSVSVLSVGHRAPAHATALGKAMLASLSPEEVDAVLTGRLRPCTSATITELPVLRAELRRIRGRRGLAFEREEHRRGMFGVGAVVRVGDGIPGALAASAAAGVAPIERAAPLVLEAARRISLRLDPDAAAAAASPPSTADVLVGRVLALLGDDALL
ncbi:IclR family transcriptional regulator [Nocardia beijingensis]|uniref:IclR family transcriptional regulator n=1 Tax=Nocardia beijingensis TaxID=95162 RepID=UPI0014709293|nr:IclR family transcriptional regulator [Nocardia beijingensis]